MLHKTKNYCIEVGPSSDKEQVTYHLVNRDTGVIEFENSMLPNMIEMMVYVQAQLTESKKTLKEAKAAGIVLPELEDKGGSDGLH